MIDITNCVVFFDGFTISFQWLTSNLKPYSSKDIKSCQLVRNVRQAILLWYRPLSSTSFKFVPLSFRMLSMYFSQDVRGLLLGLFPFTFRSRTFFAMVWEICTSLYELFFVLVVSFL